MDDIIKRLLDFYEKHRKWAPILLVVLTDIGYNFTYHHR
jgi:hypothetical protein